jgi:uncharacterized protein YycO
VFKLPIILTSMLALLSTFTSCSLVEQDRNFRGIASTSPADETFVDNLELHEEFLNFQKHVEMALAWRARSYVFYADIIKKRTKARSEGKEYILNASDLRRLREGTEGYQSIRDVLIKLVDAADFYLEDDDFVTIVEKQATFIRKKRIWRIKYGSEKLTLNPYDQPGRIHTKKLKMALAAGLVLYDNFFFAIRYYQNDKQLRRLINLDNHELSDYLLLVAKNYRSLENHAKTSLAIDYYKQFRKREFKEKNNPDFLLRQDPKNAYLNHLIDQSFTYNQTQHKSKAGTVIKNVGEKIVGLSRRIEDQAKNISSGVTNDISKVFGNSVGLISTRKEGGKLLKLTSYQRNKIKKQLKPLDVLFEKTPFRLTDKFIPGHWGHVAVWVGTEQELKKLGVWNELPNLYQKAVDLYGYSGPSFQTLIKTGHNIIEALRPGVQLNSLDHFLNIDDLAAIRPKSSELSLEQRKDALLVAFSQIGKEYDFNFDVSSNKKIVCSELAYVVFGDPNFVTWPTSKELGRYTISPDHVAKKAIKRSDPFYPVLIYSDGRKVSKNLSTNFNRLLNQQYKQIQYDY